MTTQVAVRQAFGSPGGKTKLAPKIVAMMPEHRVYVEPFAGGAAVYFKKGVSEKEVLNDKDAEIAFAFRFLRDMTPQQYEWLKKQNWNMSLANFERIKNLSPRTDAERFYKFYYLKRTTFACGSGTRPNFEHKSTSIDHLPKVHLRLRRATVQNTTALQLVNKYDSPSTLFYLDPPYPDRAFVGQKFPTYTASDLKQLTDRLQHIKGKFILSLGTEHAKLMPARFHVERARLRRNLAIGGGDYNNTFQYEIICTNFNPKAKTMQHFEPIERDYSETLKPPRNGFAGRPSRAAAPKQPRMARDIYSHKGSLSHHPRGQRMSRRGVLR